MDKMIGLEESLYKHQAATPKGLFLFCFVVPPYKTIYIYKYAINQNGKYIHLLFKTIIQSFYFLYLNK
jgi:hypothetical protein